jgi:transcriptional regulator of acetoin/glycerol metabolism
LREELHFLGEVDEGFWAGLASAPYAWPGNARGLRNILLKAILRSKQDRLTREDLPSDLWKKPGSDATRCPEDDSPCLNPDAIHAVLGATRHNVSETARRLGVHRSTVYRRLSRAPKRH